MKKLALCVVLAAVFVQAWAIPGYDYYRHIQINASRNVTDYQQPIYVPWNANMQADFDDINFTDYEDSAPLVYYMENKTDSTGAYFWVNLDVNTLNQSIHMWYGSAGAVTSSDYYQTFLPGSWEETDNSKAISDVYEPAGSTLTYGVDADGWVYITATSTAPYLLRAIENYTSMEYVKATYIAKVDTIGSDWLMTGFKTYDNTAYRAMGQYYQVGSGSAWFQMECSGGSSYTTSNYPAANAEYYYQIITNATAAYHFKTNTSTGILQAIGTTTTPSWYLSLHDASSVTASWRNIRIRHYFTPEPTYEIGAEIPATAEVTLGGETAPVVNTLANYYAVGSAATNLTGYWWDFGDGGTDYTGYNFNYTIHNYTTTGPYNVTVEAHDILTGTNLTDTLEIEVQPALSSINISIDSYLPFLLADGAQYLNYSKSGGSSTTSQLWNITLPNASVFQYTNITSLNFTPGTTGTYSVALRVCDMADGTCKTDTDSWRAWNISGGIFSISPFNATSRMAAAVLIGDSVTFTASDSLLWNLSTFGAVGTSATLTFNSTYPYWDDGGNYYHYNISLYNHWGSYTSTEWVTVVAAGYNLTAACAQGHSYCFIYGAMYDEETLGAINASNLWNAYLVTTTAAGYQLEQGLSVSNYDLNLSLCMNATPSFSTLTLDGYITYEADGYVLRMHSFDAASMPITGTCTASSNNYFEFYTATNTSEIYPVTITVLRGGAALSDALVQVEYYFNDTGTGEGWAEVASQITDSQGQVQLNLKLCPVWYKFKISQDGDLLHEEKTCLKSTSHTIAVEGTLPEFYQIYAGIITACAWDNTTNYLSCSVTEPTGRAMEVELNVYSSLSDTPVCTSAEASASTTLLCDMGGQPDGSYGYELRVKTAAKPTGYIINSGGFTKGLLSTITYDGAVLGFLLLTIALFGAPLHPLLMIIIATLGFIGLGIMGLIAVPYSVIGWLLAMALVALAVVIK